MVDNNIKNIRPELEEKANINKTEEEIFIYDYKKDIQEMLIYKRELRKEDKCVQIIVSAVGDVTLGRDEGYGYWGSLDHELELQKGDYGFFLKNVKNIFEMDDLTIINLEGTLTTSIKKANKKFRFKGSPLYTKVLKAGSIEVVNLANNHTYDYLERGYLDTIENLKKADIGFFGYDTKYVKNIKGIKIGMLGFLGWDNSKFNKKQIKSAIEDLKEKNTDIIIVSFHWGVERTYYPNYIQRDLGHFVIENGGDLVLGHHPHVIQGIEKYKGKNIVYSLGNFCFGGNRNPQDKDTMIYKHKFNFKNNELESQESEIIPTSISSIQERNNYQPTPLAKADRDRVLNRIRKYSEYIE